MTDDMQKTTMMEVVKEALLAEVKGQQLYAHAASTTTDPSVKAIFKSLAKDEEAHIQILKAQAKSLFDSGSLDLGVVSTEQIGAGSHAIIDDDFKKSLKRGTFEMAAIGIGCDLEKKAIAYYSENAAKTENPDLKRLFTWLTEWEKGHLSQLLDLEKFYQDAYWAEQGFMAM
jgi:rubrerythrin